MLGKKYIAFEIKSVNNEIKRLFDKSAISNNTDNLTGVQYATLGFLGEKCKAGDVYQRDLEAEFNIRRSTASAMIAQLEKNGYIVREAVQGDARLKRLVLTKKAKIADQRAKQNLDEVEGRLSQGISKEDLERFYLVLDRIAENAKEDRQE